MGQFYTIKCRECGNEEQYSLGAGFIPLDEVSYEEIQNNPEYEKIKEKIKSPGDIYESYYKIYYCKDCKTLETHITFKLHDIPSLRIRHKCKKCNKIMSGMNDFDKFYTKEKILNCSKCGAEDIFNPEEIIPGFWD